MFLNIEDDHGIVTGWMTYPTAQLASTFDDLGIPAQQLPERPAQLVESYYASS